MLDKSVETVKVSPFDFFSPKEQHPRVTDKPGHQGSFFPGLHCTEASEG